MKNLGPSISTGTVKPDPLEELRRKIAQAVARSIIEQDYMFDGEFKLPANMKVDYLDQGEVDFGEVANVILAIPEIRDRLSLQPVEPMK